MRKEEFSEILGDIDDKYINEAHAPGKAKTVRWLPKVLAACAAAGLIAGVWLARPGRDPRQDPSRNMADLPKLEVAEFVDASGFGGCWAYGIDELAADSGWDGKTVFETLPVYKNIHPTDAAGAAAGDRDALEAIVRDVAGRLGVTELTFTDERFTPEQMEEMGEEKAEDANSTLIYLQGAGGGVTVTAYGSQRVSVEFDSPVSLPDGLHFDDDASYEQMKAAGEYLKDTYAELLGMEDPVVDVQGGDRNIYADQSYTLYIYDGAGDGADRVLSHDLKGAWLYSQDGGLWLVSLDNYDLSEKVGDYPIITPEEAKALLCAGNYITMVPEEMPGEDYIARVELVYRTEGTVEYFMPYYRFLVDVPAAAYTPQARKDGTPPRSTETMRSYGAYYVPAVEGEYLTEMPVWDGNVQ